MALPCLVMLFMLIIYCFSVVKQRYELDLRTRYATWNQRYSFESGDTKISAMSPIATDEVMIASALLFTQSGILSQVLPQTSNDWLSTPSVWQENVTDFKTDTHNVIDMPENWIGDLQIKIRQAAERSNQKIETASQELNRAQMQLQNLTRDFEAELKSGLKTQIDESMIIIGMAERSLRQFISDTESKLKDATSSLDSSLTQKIDSAMAKFLSKEKETLSKLDGVLDFLETSGKDAVNTGKNEVFQFKSPTAGGSAAAIHVTKIETGLIFDGIFSIPRVKSQQLLVSGTWDFGQMNMNKKFLMVSKPFEDAIKVDRNSESVLLALTAKIADEDGKVIDQLLALKKTGLTKLIEAEKTLEDFKSKALDKLVKARSEIDESLRKLEKEADDAIEKVFGTIRDEIDKLYKEMAKSKNDLQKGLNALTDDINGALQDIKEKYAEQKKKLLAEAAIASQAFESQKAEFGDKIVTLWNSETADNVKRFKKLQTDLKSIRHDLETSRDNARSVLELKQQFLENDTSQLITEVKTKYDVFTQKIILEWGIETAPIFEKISNAKQGIDTYKTDFQKDVDGIRADMKQKKSNLETKTQNIRADFQNDVDQLRKKIHANMDKELSPLISRKDKLLADSREIENDIKESFNGEFDKFLSEVEKIEGMKSELNSIEDQLKILKQDGIERIKGFIKEELEKQLSDFISFDRSPLGSVFKEKIDAATKEFDLSQRIQKQFEKVSKNFEDKEKELTRQIEDKWKKIKNQLEQDCKEVENELKGTQRAWEQSRDQLLERLDKLKKKMEEEEKTEEVQLIDGIMTKLKESAKMKKSEYEKFVKEIKEKWQENQAVRSAIETFEQCEDQYRKIKEELSLLEFQIKKVEYDKMDDLWPRIDHLKVLLNNENYNVQRKLLGDTHKSVLDLKDTVINGIDKKLRSPETIQRQLTELLDANIINEEWKNVERRFKDN